METLHLQLKGMSCASCTNTIEQAVKGIPGVKTCNVNFGIEQASVQYNAQQTNADQITRAESQVGYSAVPTQEFGAEADDAEQTVRQAEQHDLTRKVIIGGVLSALLIIGTIARISSLPLLITPQGFPSPLVFYFPSLAGYLAPLLLERLWHLVQFLW